MAGVKHDVVMLVADYAPAMIDGAGVRPFEGGAPLSRGAEIITLTGREAVGIDRAGRPRPLGPARFAVAAIARLGSLRTALPAYAEDERVPALAARAYAAVAGDANGDLLIAAAPIDPDATANDLRDDPDLPARISVVLGELPGNRLARQLARCARDYRCRAAANAFAGVADCALPVAAPANERPPGPAHLAVKQAGQAAVGQRRRVGRVAVQQVDDRQVGVVADQLDGLIQLRTMGELAGCTDLGDRQIAQLLPVVDQRLVELATC